MRKHANYYQQHCSTFRCGHTYWTLNETTPCPKCNISERMIDIAGTNDREAVIKYMSTEDGRNEYYASIRKDWDNG